MSGEEDEVFIYGPLPLWPLSRNFRILVAVYLAVTWFGRETWTGISPSRYLPVY